MCAWSIDPDQFLQSQPSLWVLLGTCQGACHANSPQRTGETGDPEAKWMQSVRLSRKFGKVQTCIDIY